jgi:hypothetical protein
MSAAPERGAGDGRWVSVTAALYGVWALGLAVFAGTLAISMNGNLHVAAEFYPTAAGVLSGLLIAVVLELSRHGLGPVAFSVFTLLAAAQIIAVVAVAAPPRDASPVFAAILGCMVAGILGLGLLLVDHRSKPAP